jgi:hypothetical protein
MEAATARQLARALRPGWNDLAVSWLGDNRQSPDEAQHDVDQGTDDMEQEAEEEEELPKEWLCPITGQLMQDPAVTSCGHLFDRTAIHQWLTKVCIMMHSLHHRCTANSLNVCHSSCRSR